MKHKSLFNLNELSKVLGAEPQAIDQWVRNHEVPYTIECNRMLFDYDTLKYLMTEYKPHINYWYAARPSLRAKTENQLEYAVKHRDETMPAQFQERDVLSLEHLRQLNDGEDVI